MSDDPGWTDGAPGWRGRVRCQVDWQGPSDPECVDDLVVISCGERYGLHAGLHWGEHPDGTPVWWRTGTSDLLDQYGHVHQRQFTDSPRP